MCARVCMYICVCVCASACLYVSGCILRRFLNFRSPLRGEGCGSALSWAPLILSKCFVETQSATRLRARALCAQESTGEHWEAQVNAATEQVKAGASGRRSLRPPALRFLRAAPSCSGSVCGTSSPSERIKAVRRLAECSSCGAVSANC